MNRTELLRFAATGISPAALSPAVARTLPQDELWLARRPKLARESGDEPARRHG